MIVSTLILIILEYKSAFTQIETLFLNKTQHHKKNFTNFVSSIILFLDILDFENKYAIYKRKR